MKLPGSLVSIGAYAFRDCWNLKEITFDGLKAQWNAIKMGNDWNMGHDFCTVKCTDGTVNYEVDYDCGCGAGYCYCGGAGGGEGGNARERAVNLTIPAETLQLASKVYKGCVRLKSVKIEDGVLCIGKRAFEDCKNLESIEIPDSVSYIGEAAFVDCSSLSSIVIPDGVTTLENATFLRCYGLKNVTLPAGLTYISYSAFQGCDKLESIVFKGTQEQWDAIYRDEYDGLEFLASLNAKVKCLGKEKVGK